MDKQYLKFGAALEKYFITQDPGEERTIEQTLDMGWQLLSLLPRGELDRVSARLLDAYYHEGAWEKLGTEAAAQDGQEG